MRRGALGAVVVVAAIALLAAPASATDLSASNTTELINDVNQLNQAPDTFSDRILLTPGTYTLSGQLSFTGDALTIEGTGTAANTIIRQTAATRVIDINNGGDDVDLNDITITGGNVSGGGTAGSGGGVRNLSNGDLFVLRSAVEGNRASLAVGAPGGGGGIYSAAGAVVLNQSSVSNNRVAITSSGSGGGGIWAGGNPTINDSTLSGNVVTATGSPTGSGGGGMFTSVGGGAVSTSTFADNSALAGQAIYNAGGTSVLADSIFAGGGSQCGGTAPTPGGTGNIDTGNTCLASLPNTDPKIGPLANNGGGTKTRALAADSPAVDSGGGCTSTFDQRGVERTPNGDNCSLGAYEFDGISVAQVPDCSPTGVIPLGMAAPPNSGVEAFHYKLDGVQQADLPFAGGPSASASLNVPEGRRALEYWGQFSGYGAGELGHHTPTVLVDKTDPSVAIKSEQKKTIYVITRKASVDVNATDALSGLTGDPSANGERLGTRSRGKKAVTKTATDLCGNQQSATLDYRVLGPGLGTRAVLEKLKGKVRIKRPGGSSSAGAAQKKGGGFVSLSQPREIPIGSFIDTKRGTLRLTSSKSKRATAIQDGQFSGGLFQVLQSRKKRAKGLTELRLKGGKSFKACATGKGASASLSKRALRRLRANAKGRFRTRGRFSAATVRGTKFTVTDRCDGTLTKVTRGRVAVRDFRRHKTVIVRTGKSYLAKAPG